MSELVNNVDNEPSLTPPSPQRVAARALVLAAIVYRGFLEENPDKIEAETLRKELLDWLNGLDILAELEVNEKRLLNTLCGSLQPRQQVQAEWRCEGVAVLAWALQRFMLPAYDEQVDPKVVNDSLGFLTDEAKNLIASPSLREPEELRRYAEVAFSLHWRLRDFALRPKHIDFEKLAKEAWFGPLEISGLRLIEGDLAIRNTPIAATAEHQFQECLGTTQERRQAAQWLIGDHEIYSEVSLDT